MIPPIVFYLADLFDGLKSFFLIIGFCSGITSAILFGMLATGVIYDSEVPKAKKFARAFAAVFAVTIALGLFIPSKEAMVEMLVAKYATAENAKAIIDYIVETWVRLK